MNAAYEFRIVLNQLIPQLTRQIVMEVEDASVCHVGAMAEIYNHAVTNTTAVWTESTLDADSMNIWLEHRKRAGYPVLVAIGPESEVVGYASFCGWRNFDGYRYTVESSVYVRYDRQRLGIGTLLMGALIKRAEFLGKHAIIAGIDAENVGSLSLHRTLGFREIGVAREVGTKFGRRLDLALLQLILDVDQ